MKQLMIKMKNEIQVALPSQLASERFQRVALTAFNSNPKLQTCDPMTFIAAMMQSAQLGLEPNTPLGQAYLIPYKVKGMDKVQFQIGYKGLLELAHRSGKIKTLYAHEVRKNDEFDIDITQIFSRKNTKTTKNAGYKWMPVNQVFDYLPRKSDKTYELSFRIIRFPIGSNSYEIIITNLDRNIFDVKKIKEIYHLRWGIETSFRELKYAIGLTSFHARKPDFIKQEIYARLLLYNYCELITTYVIKQMKNNDKTKQVNFTIAIYICREYLRNKRNLSPPDVINLIEKHVLPVRPGRKEQIYAISP